MYGTCEKCGHVYSGITHWKKGDKLLCPSCKLKTTDKVVEMYACPSYVNDDRKLVDCKCGKCPPMDDELPDEEMTLGCMDRF